MAFACLASEVVALLTSLLPVLAEAVLLAVADGVAVGWPPRLAGRNVTEPPRMTCMCPAAMDELAVAVRPKSLAISAARALAAAPAP